MLQDDSEKPTRLLGPTVDPMFYEDERALTEYVWKHYQHLMTPFELRVGLYSVPILSDMENEKGRRIYEYCETTHGHVEDKDVIDAFPRDLYSFRQSTQQRLMRECSDGIHVNRCPKCSRIVRSPSARQCPWCKHRWHK